MGWFGTSKEVKIPTKKGSLAEEEWAKVHHIQAAVKAKRTDREVAWCNDDCVRRYLRARQWDASKALAMVMETLDFRKKWDCDAINDDLQALEDLKASSENAAVYLSPFVDREGHIIINMHCGRGKQQTTADFEQNIKHVIYHLERACRQFDERLARGEDTTLQEKWIFFFDFSEFGYTTAPPMQTSKTTLEIFQKHYPERLFKACFFFPPMAFKMFWAVIVPLVDPVSRAKVLFVSTDQKASRKELEAFVALDQVQVAYGGTSEWNFQDADTRADYWASDLARRQALTATAASTEAPTDGAGAQASSGSAAKEQEEEQKSQLQLESS